MTSPIVRAFVLVKLWGWFVIPAFGLLPLSKINAYGLALILFFLTPLRATDKRPWKEILPEAWVFLILTSGVALLFGWLAVLLRAAIS